MVFARDTRTKSDATTHGSQHECPVIAITQTGGE
jgi:hypothetical protein